jgi:hypothetical protein
MFAPKVAKPQPFIAFRPAIDLVRRLPLIQQTTGRREERRPFEQQASGVIETGSGADHEHEVSLAEATALSAPRSVSWDFSGIPLFSLDRSGGSASAGIGGLPQRQCACGGSAGGGAGCKECRSRAAGGPAV